ncbi:RNase J family beta-CASP ribonuclease [Candidatus Pacearchaeota archaeon]|nr:RNase J family beta-CASP ribonuclease [Candidatus Pacearchaeota archaeon]
MITLYTIGGYNEVGKNMTALQVGNDVIIIDAGLFLPPIVELEEEERVMTEKKLRAVGALPDDLMLDKFGLRNKVRAILASHAHLDHIGAIPYIAGRYNAEIIATPFSVEVLKTLLRDENLNLNNPIRAIHPNSSYIVKGQKQYKVEFINVTHSTLQTSIVVVHTDDGAIMYANDFKFDNTPIIGKRPNYERLKEIAQEEGVIALVVDSLYAGEDRKTPSEKIARGLLEDVLLTTSNETACIVVTTFSSHLARLKSIVDFGKQLGRKVVFAGRSLNKYVSAANRLKLIPFNKDIMLLSYKNQVRRMLKKIEADREKYMLVCTGHQGEPGSMLDRLSRNQLPFKFRSQDHVVFSSRTIPTAINIANKQQLGKRLKDHGVRIFDTVHVSGHAGREDLRDFINMVQPQHLIPAHGDIKMLTALAELGQELGYKLGRDCHIMQDSQRLKIEE